MKPCYGCAEGKQFCAGKCMRYHAWVNALHNDQEAMRRQRGIDDNVLYRELKRWNL